MHRLSTLPTLFRGTFVYPYELDFKPKNVKRDEEGHYIIIHQEDLTIIYAPNLEEPKYVNQLITNNLIDNNTIIVGTLTPQLQQGTDHLSRKSTRKQWL